MKRRWPIRVVIILLVAVALVVLLAFWLSRAAPSDYRPAELTEVQRRSAADEFWRRILQIENEAGRREPFTWVLTEQQANQWLASAPEIADKWRAGSGADVTEGLGKLRVEGPAVRMLNGVLTLMGESHRLGRVVSVDLTFTVLDDGRLSVRTEGARLGRMPVPNSLVRSMMAELRQSLPPPDAAPREPSIGPPGVSPQDLARAAALVVGAIDGEPVATHFITPANDQPLRVERVDIAEGVLTIQFAPVSD